jgi:hypothetical protein
MRAPGLLTMQNNEPKKRKSTYTTVRLPTDFEATVKCSAQDAPTASRRSVYQKAEAEEGENEEASLDYRSDLERRRGYVHVPVDGASVHFGHVRATAVCHRLLGCAVSHSART